MDGLDELAEAALTKLVGQLLTHETVQVNHSSRDVVMLRFTQSLRKHKDDMVTRKLVFRSGVSASGLRMLKEALPECHSIDELEFCCLESVEILQDALECCYLPSSSGGNNNRIKGLTLDSFNPGERRQDRGRIAQVISAALLMSDSKATQLEMLTIANYPFGAVGANILADAMATNHSIHVLRLLDCDLRSDSATHIAKMIRFNTTLRELDLSYNRHYLGSQLTREMTVKTLVQRGLRHNIHLTELGMRQTRGDPINRTKIDLHLSMNKFRRDYLEDPNRNPMAVPPELWPLVLGRVSRKPSILFMFLQESAPSLFSR